jgi:hypothetical protein
MIIRPLLFAFIVGVAACAGAPKEMAPVPMGDDRYMVGVSQMSGGRNNDELLALARIRAREFCEARGQNTQVLETTAGGSAGWVPQDARVVFRCVDRAA